MMADAMSLRRWMTRWSAMVYALSFAWPVHAQLPSNWQSPVCAVTEDGSVAYFAQMESGQLHRLRADKLMQTLAETPGRGDAALEAFAHTTADHIVDMVLSEMHQGLLIVCDQPPRLIRQPLGEGAATTIDLPASPSRVAIAAGQPGKQFVCITMPWSQSLWITELMSGSEIHSTSELEGRTVELEFAPMEVIALDRHRFLVADAVGNRLAVVEAASGRISASYSINGHHVSGLTFDRAYDTLLISHQRLSSNARSDEDDLRWGNLIQNCVSELPLKEMPHSPLSLARSAQASALTDSVLAKAVTTKAPISRMTRLGDFGHGAADPAGILSLGRQLVVALAGTDEVVLVDKVSHQSKYLSVGRVPQRLVRLGDERLLCLHRLDSRVAVINLHNAELQLECMLGTDRPITTAEQRGELAYFSGQLSRDGWMSCNSCHVEGQSPDLIVDTQSDGSFNSPKKIPALQQVVHTGPWSWLGNHATLHDQLSKTLRSTMHTPDQLPASTGLVHESLIEDLEVYLAGFEPLVNRSEKVVAAANVASGESHFKQHCARCHDPALRFTSPKTHDVGLSDESGHKLFNPPSLNGLNRRTRFMHDGRFSSLKDVLRAHPDPTNAVTDTETESLMEYLRRL